MIIKCGTIIAAPMGDPNASIPTPQPVHYRPMFGAVGGALAQTSVTFLSAAALDGGLAGAARPRQAPGRRQRHALDQQARHGPQPRPLPKIEVDSETSRCARILLRCEPAKTLPLTQRYFLF